MFNPFVIRKYASLLLTAMSAVIMFYIGVSFYNLLYGIGFLFAGLLLGVLVSVKILLKNPFTDMLEGKGILCANLDSTGIWSFFIVKVDPPWIKGKYAGKQIKDVFDRKAAQYIKAPIKNVSKAVFEDGKLKIELSEDEYNKAKFALYHYPLLIWNDQLGTFMTKDFFADAEKNAFAEHGILLLNREIEALTTYVRDFSRGVVELLKPKGDIFKSPLFWIILVVIGLVFVVLFGPPIFNAIQGFVGGGTESMASTLPDAVTPR